jgi:hypothetical protein
MRLQGFYSYGLGVEMLANGFRTVIYGLVLHIPLFPLQFRGVSEWK